MDKKELVCDCNVIHQDAVNMALKNQPDINELENLSELFKIIGDLTRTKILWILDRHEMCVCDISCYFILYLRVPA